MTFTEIASGLDKAISSTTSKKAALDAARKVVVDAEQAYADSITAVKSLHAEYSKLMQDVLSLGGTLHK